MRAEEIRRAFLSFFEARGHRVVDSAPLVPAEDPTLLFTNAGMVPFKDLFTGARPAPYRRAASCQRCVRAGGKHNDLENVGRTRRHHTFFEMLGNFSFGDYFKDEAIEFAWALLTKTLGIPEDRLLPTVHPEDDEAARLWRRVAGFEEARIPRDPENFWQMGETGPCGPCSEIYLVPPGGRPEAGLEIWNLVFMQFERLADGTTRPLPAPSIDTGAGLERLAAILQGAPSNFETDLFRPIISAIEGATDRRFTGRFGDGADDDVSFRVVADHVRAATFLVADGVVPSNEGRGYVLRRILRRAMRHGRRLGWRAPTLYRLVGVVCDGLDGAYPHLRARRRVVEETVRREEEAFLETIDRGLAILEEALAPLRAGARLDGAVAFRLYDTFGFPLDLTQTIAEERGVRVDVEGFEREMGAQRRRSKETARFARTEAEGPAALEALFPTAFVGYDADEAEATVLYTSDGLVVLDRTPFYAEGGGQVADVGTLEAGGRRWEVSDVRKNARGVYLHRLAGGAEGPSVGQRVRARIDSARRRAAERHHTATHLLHAALRGVLGEHVGQAGSLVEPGRLRFDFTHPRPLSPEEIREVERRAYEPVIADVAVRWAEHPIEEARRMGAMAFFGEKYGDVVRVVEVEGTSKEFCGGTHVRRTGEIGLVKIVAEAGVAAGVRRVEAVAGAAALAWVQDLHAVLGRIAARLAVPPAAAAARVEALLAERREAEKRALARAEDAARAALAGAAEREIVVDGGVRLVTARVKGAGAEALRSATRDTVRRGGDRVVVAAGDACLVVQVAPTLTGRLSARDLLADLAALCGARGGGRADFAQAGGADPARLPGVLERAAEVVRARLGAGP